MYPYVVYKPFAERKPDGQYKNLLREILKNGVWYDNQMEEAALTLLGAQLKYEIANGAPLITERDIVKPGKNGRSYASQALGEIIAFVNGARTQEELESFGCFWWKNWLTPAKCKKRGLKPGEMGPGSYGAAWTDFPTSSGGFNQINALIAQIKERPRLRTHVITPWIPQFVFRITGHEQKVVVVPCHGWVNVRINTETGGLTLIHHQRSADIPVGFPANMLAYTAFALMVAKITGYTAEKIIFSIDDAHIYQSQMESVEKMLTMEDQKLPTLTLANERQLITDFRVQDFEVADYFPTGPRMIIPTPI
ncbi:hypothetical protein A2382_05360 [Candidatus Woesebacteria bacterium RIFOXYB1_FULL_38_16]|uniref:thymidylate synthase n=1 Tax=Candidatus Woesebacteria bacterium RIFOXYB1_FULL_38_16 TaxID=1802538 RepID=A0A1F8CR52_9BACT|nr:MAG: hypothetical protein A2382_05360 [Candidatus Woesebacteria bacterium RIFOXYB1_FULL_38_16]